LLRQKLVVALTFSFGANLLLPGWAYLIGGIFFGWAPAKSPFGGTVSYPETVQRMQIVVVVSNILDSITALDPYRVVLPTHFQYSWLDALTPQISWADMIRGTALV